MPISDCAKPVKVTVLRGNCRLLVRSAIPTSQSQPMAAWKCFCLNSDEARISSVSNLRSTIRGKGFSRTDWILKDNVRNGSPGGGKMFKTRASEKPENDSPLKSQGEPVRSKGFLDAFIGPLLQSLSDFGFGRRSIWEGGVGLFIITGGFMFALLISWAKGRQVRSSSTRYQTVFEFSQACGITVGTPVRIRGVDVGSVIGVKPSLERIDVTAEIMDAGVVIPRNSLVEVNQSGLISETLIDITPQNPIPRPTVGPLHPECHNEGLIVCDRQHITGVQGVSLDELVGICTKLAKQMDQEGIQSMFQAMDKVSETIDDAKPLLDKVSGFFQLSLLTEMHFGLS